MDKSKEFFKRLKESIVISEVTHLVIKIIDAIIDVFNPPKTSFVCVLRKGEEGHAYYPVDDQKSDQENVDVVASIDAPDSVDAADFAEPSEAEVEDNVIDPFTGPEKYIK